MEYMDAFNTISENTYNVVYCYSLFFIKNRLNWYRITQNLQKFLYDLIDSFLFNFNSFNCAHHVLNELNYKSDMNVSYKLKFKETTK